MLHGLSPFLPPHFGSLVANKTALNDLGEAAQSIGTSVQGVLSGNQTVQEGLSTVGDAFSSFGNNLVDGLQQTGSQIAEASQDIFCSALSFLCP